MKKCPLCKKKLSLLRIYMVPRMNFRVQCENCKTQLRIKFPKYGQLIGIVFILGVSFAFYFYGSYWSLFRRSVSLLSVILFIIWYYFSAKMEVIKD